MDKKKKIPQLALHNNMANKYTEAIEEVQYNF